METEILGWSREMELEMVEELIVELKLKIDPYNFSRILFEMEGRH